MKDAFPKKLPNGSWGAQIVGKNTNVHKGDIIKVTSRGGKTWQARVSAIMSRSPTIVATESVGDQRRQQRAERTERTERRSNHQEGEQSGEFRTLDRGYNKGLVGHTILLNVKGERIPVTCVGYHSQYVAEDGLSFGFPEDSGQFTTRYYRRATEEEAAPHLQKMREQQEKQARETEERQAKMTEYLAKREELLAGLRQTNAFPEGVTRQEQLFRYKDGTMSVAFYRASDGGVFETASLGFDDLRNYYHGTEEAVRAAVITWAKIRQITPDKAKEWLARYSGCEGESDYQLIAEMAD